MDRSSCAARRHGTYSAYRNGCRCDDAREDYFHYRKAQRLGIAESRRIPALGYSRMSQALMAAGWPYAEQADLCGVRRSTLEHLAYHPWVSRQTAQKVGKMFADFANVDGPNQFAAAQAWALEYPPPGAWVGCDIHDPTAVADWIRPDDPDDVEAARVARGTMPLSALGPVKVRGRIVVQRDHVTAYLQAKEHGTSDRALIAEWGVSIKVLDRLRERGAA